MKRSLVLFAAATLALAGTAAAGSRSKGIDYAAYAGDPIPEFQFTKLYNWQRTGDKTMVLWTKPSSASVLDLRNMCYDLSGPGVVNQVAGVAATPGRLSVNDDLIVGEMKCKISAIRPVDLEAIKRARKPA
jgi:hypothetical protein